MVEEAISISTRTLYRWLDAYIADSPASPHTASARSSVFTDEQLQTMREFYESQPCLFAYEMRDIMNRLFLSEFTEKQVQYALLHDLHLTYKVLEQQSTQRNDYLRALWRLKIIENLKNVPACMFVVVDETHLLICLLKKRFDEGEGHAKDSKHFLVTG